MLRRILDLAVIFFLHFGPAQPLHIAPPLVPTYLQPRCLHLHLCYMTDGVDTYRWADGSCQWANMWPIILA